MRVPWAGQAVPEGYFTWPAEGRISSLFGPRGYADHDGIDIAASEGTPIRSAAPGVVLYSGVLRGYGRTVIVAHEYGLTSVYAHNHEIFVRPGARVRRGTVIASMGRTGRVTGPNLHFEIRRENVARDPLAYLPRREPAVLAGKRPLLIGG
jgi:murein DD-endopeptidase MepM/ murein hydrolase activator NlpD